MRLVLVLFLLLLSLQAAAWCERPLRVNVGEWQPYVHLQKDGGVTGIDIELLKRVTGIVKCRLAFVQVPAARAHDLLAAGEIDILMAASDLPERRAYAWFSRPYRQEEMVVLALAGAKKPDSFAALAGSGQRLLAPRFGWYGRGYARWRQPLLDAGRLQFYDHYAQGMAMLAVGRGDLILGDARALQQVESGMALGRAFVANASPVHMMLSRRTFTAGDVKRINDALAVVLREDAAARRAPAGARR